MTTPNVSTPIPSTEHITPQNVIQTAASTLDDEAARLAAKIRDNDPLHLHNLSAPRDARGRLVHPDILQRSFDEFMRLDTDHEQRIGERSLRHAINAFSTLVKVTPEQAHEIISITTRGESDKLTFSQFFTVYSALQVLQQLQTIDLSHVHRKHIARALSSAGLQVTDAQLDRMVILADQYASYERTGQINFVDFLSSYVETPHSPQSLFLHSWWVGVGRNATPFVKSATTSPLQDFIAGTVAGVAITVVGAPFDCVKVRMQVDPDLFRGGFDCAMQTIRNEGPLALFKGMLSPLLTIPFSNAIVFWAYGLSKDWLHKMQPVGEKKPLTLGQISICGAMAGAASCIVATPVELVKLRMQLIYDAPVSRATSMTTVGTSTAAGTSSHAYHHAHFGGMACPAVGASASDRPTGPFDVIKRIVQKEGIRGLYRGMSATVYRELAGYSVQFSTYEALKKKLAKPGQKSSELDAMRTITAGGLAGAAGWLASYPQDYVKSLLQASDKTVFKKNPYLFDGGFFDCFRQTVKQHGVMSVWRGFGPCVLRAFPANAAGFFAYEGVLKSLQASDYF